MIMNRSDRERYDEERKRQAYLEEEDHIIMKELKMY